MNHSKTTTYQWAKIPTGDGKEGAAWPLSVLPGEVQVDSRLDKWTAYIQQHFERMTRNNNENPKENNNNNI